MLTSAAFIPTPLVKIITNNEIVKIKINIPTTTNVMGLCLVIHPEIVDSKFSNLSGVISVSTPDKSAYVVRFGWIEIVSPMP